jgi:hypothetical protein
MPASFDVRNSFDRFGMSDETLSLAPFEAVAFAREWDRTGWGLLCGGNEFFRGDWVSPQGRTIEQGFDSLELAASVADRFWVSSESGRRVSALVVVR